MRRNSFDRSRALNNMNHFLRRARQLEEGSTSRVNTLDLATKTSWINKLFSKNNNLNSQVIEQMVNTDREIEVMTNDYISTLEPITLYKTDFFHNNQGLIKTHRSEKLQIPDGKVETFGLMTPETIDKLCKQHLSYVHLGMITVGIRGLTRKQSGTKVLIIALDTRNQQSIEKQMIGVVEVDMNNNVGIFHLLPDYTIATEDIPYIQFQVQTKGFGNFKGSNLTLDIVFLGKLSAQICPRFKIKTDEIIQAVKSKGIEFFGPQPVDSSILAGQEWKIENTITQPETLRPTEVLTYSENNGPLRIRFNNYQSSNQQDSEVE